MDFSCDRSTLVTDAAALTRSFRCPKLSAMLISSPAINMEGAAGEIMHNWPDMKAILEDLQSLPFASAQYADAGRLDQIELGGSNSWKMRFNPDECNNKAITRRMNADGAVLAWKNALMIRRNLQLPLKWRTRHVPYAEVEFVDSVEELDAHVHDHACGDLCLLVQCLLHQERLTGTVHPEVATSCVSYPWKSLKQYVDLLIYLTNFRELQLQQALDLPQECLVDTTLAHLCDLVARIIAAEDGLWKEGAVWFFVAVYSEERYSRHKLRQEARKLQLWQKRVLEELITGTWFKDMDSRLARDLLPDLKTAKEE